MKHILIILMMVFALYACGGTEDENDSGDESLASCSSYFNIGDSESAVYRIHGSPDLITNNRCVSHTIGKVVVTVCGNTLNYGDDIVDIWNGKVQTVKNTSGTLCF